MSGVPNLPPDVGRAANSTHIVIHTGEDERTRDVHQAFRGLSEPSQTARWNRHDITRELLGGLTGGTPRRHLLVRDVVDGQVLHADMPQYLIDCSPRFVEAVIRCLLIVAGWGNLEILFQYQQDAVDQLSNAAHISADVLNATPGLIMQQRRTGAASQQPATGLVGSTAGAGENEMEVENHASAQEQAIDSEAGDHDVDMLSVPIRQATPYASAGGWAREDLHAPFERTTATPRNTQSPSADL